MISFPYLAGNRVKTGPYYPVFNGIQSKVAPELDVDHKMRDAIRFTAKTADE